MTDDRQGTMDPHETPPTHPRTSAAQRPQQPLQPFLQDATVILSAPTQVWSSDDGDIGDAAVHGIYHSDTRVIDELRLTVGGNAPEPITTRSATADEIVFVSVLRAIDDMDADPKVRLDRRRTVRDGIVEETMTFSSTLPEPVDTTARLVFVGDFSSLHLVKAGRSEADAAPRPRVDGSGIHWAEGAVRAVLSAHRATANVDEAGTASLSWGIRIPARGSVSVRWHLRIRDASAVVHGATTPRGWGNVVVHSGDTRLQRWVTQALDDLESLRMTTTIAPDDVFLAAGAPWFFTLFGRDSIWAARFLLPFGTELAASTLRVLAALQGAREVDETAEQPGKVVHELRPATLEIPGEGVSLPPLYYGTVDATALWACLLHDAWRWGMPRAEVEALLPNLEAALAWMRDYGDSDGDGFLEYADTTGHGLANQGWKDSGDSIQWADGRLADGPIALCEVQGYAYAAAIGGAELLDAFGRPGAGEWRRWATRLKERFAESFWVTEPADGGSAYPAVALDADKRAVDTVTSNIGHLLGTGILDSHEARLVADRLGSTAMDSGFGLRTMSTDAMGYWPLSYHGGSVWTHDTAIAIAGLVREGFTAEAASLTRGLLAAAEGFDFRMPELHSGDPAVTVDGERAGGPVPYPAACRPQAWSAAAAVSVLTSALGLEPRDGSLLVSPLQPAPAGALTVRGLRYGDDAFELDADEHGQVLRNTLDG